MTAIELNAGALKLHRDRYDDTTESTLVNILWACEERDTYLIGEPWALVPYGGIEAYTLHNIRLDVCYTLDTRDIERIARGGVVTLQPHAPEDWEREEIEREEVEGALCCFISCSCRS